jgi:hypothetical protein
LAGATKPKPSSGSRFADELSAEALRVADRDVLNATIAVVDQLVDLGLGVEGLLERIEDVAPVPNARTFVRIFGDSCG